MIIYSNRVIFWSMIGFASRLRELRKAAKQRQKDLADALGVAQTTIANYEQGARFPDEKTLMRIADHYDVSLDFLMGRSHVNSLGREVHRPSGFYRDKEEALAPMNPLARKYLQLLLAGNREAASDLVHRAVQDGAGIAEIYRDVFERTLKEVGLMWVQNKADVATEHYFSASTQLIMSQLYPHITAASPAKRQRVCLVVAVNGEFHDIGARMVADFLEMDGWKTFFLGSNLDTEDIVKAVIEHRADLLSLSATMFFSLETIARTVRRIREVESLQQLVVLVGGRPFNQNDDLWKQVQADGMARNAEEEVRLANRLAARGAGH